MLADWVRRATEQVAEHAGGTIGSLLNVSFGNAAELVLALFVLSQAQTQVVQAQITGSIIGTTLLFLGIAALVGGAAARAADLQPGAGRAAVHPAAAAGGGDPAAGGLRHDRAAACRPAANLSLLDERLSLCVSVVLLLLYGAHLIYVLVTHRVMFGGGPTRAAPSPSGACRWGWR